jgi:CDGSH-type Zn-finger protein
MGAAEREVEIVPYRDGPYLVRGAFSLKDQNGIQIDVSRRIIALCRCGKSRTRPFCDGTHRLTRFRASSEAERPAGTESQSHSSDGAVTNAAPADRTNLTPASVGALSRSPARLEHGRNSETEAPAASASWAPNLPVVRAHLQAAEAEIQRLQQSQLPASYRSDIGIAQSLIAAAHTMVNDTARRAAGDRGDWAREAAPCRCLVRGALAVIRSSLRIPRMAYGAWLLRSDRPPRI